ncbi:hypothetical protein [Intrasporangium calvum]|uniref:hypothetical protein n=1 Tax=Intrasporangium calvum TaxID=53358 RepID=UPI003B58609F
MGLKRLRDGKSVRAERQVRRLNRQAGYEKYESRIRREFQGTQAARVHETRLIQRYRGWFGHRPRGNPVDW